MMSIDQNEWDILKIYLAKTQEGTVHNLMVAYKYFKRNKQENILQALLQKVEKMSTEEFSKYIETLSSH